MADDPTPAATAVPITPAPVPTDPAPDARMARVEAVIQAWRDQYIAGGPIARAVDCWNHLDASLQPLAASILKEF